MTTMTTYKGHKECENMTTINIKEIYHATNASTVYIDR